jgi:hypothetical protein
MRNRKATNSLVILVFWALLLGSCSTNPQQPTGTLSVSELLDIAPCEAERRVFGEITELGAYRCPCFSLFSDGEKVLVRYDLKLEADGTQEPPLHFEGIENGDWVIVAGELKIKAGNPAAIELWATRIELVR